MSRIDDLIAQHCPNGVDHRPLGDLGTFVRGNGLQKSDLRAEGVGAIHYGEVHTHYGTWATVTKSYVEPEFAARLRQATPGDLVIATTSEDDQAVGKATAWLGHANVAVSGDAHIYRHSLDPKYVAYFFQTGSFTEQKKRHLTGAKVRRIAGDSLARIRIPAPPMEVQREIVAILDAFQEMEAELEAELEARRSQFYWYRDDLLRFDTQFGDSWSTFDEVGHFTRGRRFTKADVVESGIPSIHYGEIYTRYGVAAHSSFTEVRSDLHRSLRYASPGDVVIAGVGETVADVGKAVAWLGEHEVAVHDDCFIYSSSLNPKFVAYYMQTKRFNDAKDAIVSRAKVKRLSSAGLGRMPIPAPPLAEQERVVTILDAFEALISDISNGLPAELAARRKQYEYYRDKLLTFPEAS